ncbi:type II toxin-antitoxin system VapC family toxin [uncultured Methanobrevibacter sp.]|uniref:type II toxin-antitoxin system VapC family toxin n=1 Tax=uncultured Methanobrevibacter sp. TaxID=253161 RepID=UPI002617CE33|nr:type II toxin-antitoxin system VapC family toxin [uncultured Methanobrevibacter sp.]
MIFLDTGYFKGLLDKKDRHHKDALINEFLVDSNETTVINTTVLVETLNRVVGTGNSINKVFNNLHDENRVIQLTGKDYLRSLEINGWYGNSINYADCTIINTMMNLGITQIVSFDSDFKKINVFEVICNV